VFGKKTNFRKNLLFTTPLAVKTPGRQLGLLSILLLFCFPAPISHIIRQWKSKENVSAIAPLMMRSGISEDLSIIPNKQLPILPHIHQEGAYLSPPLPSSFLDDSGGLS